MFITNNIFSLLVHFSSFIVFVYKQSSFGRKRIILNALKRQSSLSAELSRSSLARKRFLLESNTAMPLFWKS